MNAPSGESIKVNQQLTRGIFSDPLKALHLYLYLWSTAQPLFNSPKRQQLPSPEENHVAIRGYLRAAMLDDGFVRSSGFMFKPYRDLQLVIMLATNGRDFRVYFAIYKEKEISPVFYFERYT